MPTQEKLTLTWNGMLTRNNIDQVADLLNELLEGKVYTRVRSPEAHNFQPRVTTGVRLEKPMAVSKIDDYAFITMRDTSGVSTILTDIDGDGLIKDESYNNPYFVFSPIQVRITHRPMGDGLTYWVFALEKERST